MRIPKKIEVLVVSFGGVGTTFLINAISNYRLTNDRYDTDGLKHYPIPPLASGRNIKLVYVYGDPILATISLFKRNYHYYHSKKLQRLDLFSRAVHKHSSLTEYVAQRKDKFHFESHYMNWRQRYITRPTLFIKYEEIHNCLDTIADFCGLPNSFVREFPPRRERKSSLDTLSDETVEGLRAMYGQFSDFVQELPPVEIAKEIRPVGQVRFKPDYLISVLQDFFGELL